LRGRDAGGGKDGRVRQSVLYGDVLQVLQAVACTEKVPIVTLHSAYTRALTFREYAGVAGRGRQEREH